MLWLENLNKNKNNYLKIKACNVKKICILNISRVINTAHLRKAPVTKKTKQKLKIVGEVDWQIYDSRYAMLVSSVQSTDWPETYIYSREK